MLETILAKIPEKIQFTVRSAPQCRQAALPCRKIAFPLRIEK